MSGTRQAAFHGRGLLYYSATGKANGGLRVSANIMSPSMAKLAVTPPVVGWVKIGI